MRRFIAMVMLLQMLAFGSVGKISALNGDISIVRGNVSVKATAGSELEEKDIVKSAKGAVAQLVFNDKTVITLGSATIFKVEEYLFDDKSPNLKFKVEEGSFKAISGKIGKIAPDKFKMETRTATIGIRGTVFMGRVDSDGELTVACTKGAIIVVPTMLNIPIVNVAAGQITKVTYTSIEQPVVFSPNELKTLHVPVVPLMNKNKIDIPSKIGNDMSSNVGQANTQKAKEKTDTAIEKVKKMKKERD